VHDKKNVFRKAKMISIMKHMKYFLAEITYITSKHCIYFSLRSTPFLLNYLSSVAEGSVGQGVAAVNTLDFAGSMYT
jgi:hypothetical protein